jgi:hypothetical protein
MRLVLLIIGGVAIGAGSVGGVLIILPQSGSMFDAVRALGGKAGSIKIGDININPVKAYEDVKRQIASGELTAPFDVAAPPVTSFRNLNTVPLNTFRLDDAAIKRSIAAGFNAQINQNINRSQDLAAYARNPMGWHGAPPH